MSSLLRCGRDTSDLDAWTRGTLSRRLRRLYHEFDPPVFLPAVLAMFFANRKLRAITDRRKPIRVGAQRDQVVFYALRSLRAKRQVVLAGSAFVAVSLDLDLRRGIGF